VIVIAVVFEFDVKEVEEEHQLVASRCFNAHFAVEVLWIRIGPSWAVGAKINSVKVPNISFNNKLKIFNLYNI
jgi:hypothetical protein